MRRLLAILSALAVAGPALGCPLPGLVAGTAGLREPAPGPVTIGFGPTRHPLLANVRMHHGVDFDGQVGDTVVAGQAGVVVFAGRNGDLGNSVEVAHGGGYVSVYGQLSRIAVTEGQCLRHGAPIGEIGCSGLCAGPHLHLELRLHGTPVDPAPFLPASSEPVPTDWHAVDAAALLDAVVALVQERFLDKQLLSRIDFAQRAARARADIVAAAEAGAAVRRINALLAALETSHTELYTPDDDEYHILADVMSPIASRAARRGDRQAFKLQTYAGIGAFTKQMAGRYFVDGVLEGSVADLAGLRYGDEIVSVDGAAYRGLASFRGRHGQNVSLGIRHTAGGEIRVVSVPVSVIKPLAAMADATRKSARVIVRGDKRIGYVHVWSSTDPEVFRAALARIEPQLPRAAVVGRAIPPNDAPGIQLRILPAAAESAPLDHLIIDMRGRIGGLMSVAGSLLSTLEGTPSAFWGRHGTTDIATWHSAYTPVPQTGPPVPGTAARPLKGRSSMLTSERTRSAAEFAAYGFRRAGFGRIYGTRTAGAVSSGQLFLMPGGLLLYLATVGHTFEQGPLEGVGVTPDVVVERPLPYAAGADPVLDAALSHIAPAP